MVWEREREREREGEGERPTVAFPRKPQTMGGPLGAGGLETALKPEEKKKRERERPTETPRGSSDKIGTIQRRFCMVPAQG